jgi:hypothetical protein
VDTVSSKKLDECRVDKLGAIIGLERNHGKVKLSTCIGDEVNEDISGIGFAPKRKSPHKMGEVVNDDKIIFKTRITRNRRCPQITMN